MFIIVIENTINGACSEIEVIRSAYNKHSIARVSKNDSSKSLGRFSQPPLTSGGWLLLCSTDCTKQTLIMLNKLPDFNIYLFHVRSSKEYTKLSELLASAGIVFRTINNLQPEKKRVVSYIVREIETTTDVAAYIYDHYNGYMPDIVNTVFALKLIHNVSRSDVKKYGVQRNRFAIFSLAEYLLGISDVMTYKDAVKIVYDYRYNFQYLAKYLKSYVKQYIVVFCEVGLGNLSIQNLGKYKPIKELKDLHQYQLKVMVSNYERISMTKLLWLYYMISNLGSSSYSSIKLISILSVNNKPR